METWKTDFHLTMLYCLIVTFSGSTVLTIESALLRPSGKHVRVMNTLFHIVKLGYAGV